MEHQLANGIHLIIEPGVCFDGYGQTDTTDIDLVERPRDDAIIVAILHTTCYLCHSPIDHRFSLGNHIPAQPQWLEETVHCRKCDVYQKKKIRFYVKDDAYEAFLRDRYNPINYVTEYDHCISAKERQVEDCVGCPYRGNCDKEVDYHGNT